MQLFILLKRLVAVAGAFFYLTAAAAASPLPFVPGETLRYEVSWGSIPVARVHLAVMPLTDLDGEPAFHFVLRAQTYPIVDLLYPVSGRMDAYTNRSVTRTLRLEKDMREGRSRKTYRVDFDWNAAVARYKKEGRKRRELRLPEGTLDLVSILYHARSLPLEPGMAISRPLNSGRRQLLARAKVMRRETVAVAGRQWPAFLIKPDVRKAGGVFKKSKNAELYLWISTDQHKIPLKMISRVRVGYFSVELAEVSHRLSEPAVGRHP